MKHSKLLFGIIGAIVALYAALGLVVWQQHRLEKAHNETSTAVRLGASSPQLVGQQAFGQNTRLLEDAWDHKHINGGACGIVYSAPSPPAGEVLAYASITVVTYDSADASVNCDGGNCAASIRRYLPGTLQGGQFCRLDGTCAGTDGGGIDQAVDSFESTSGILNGATSQILWTGTTVAVQVCCPTNGGCYSNGRISGDRVLPTNNGFDGGPVDASSDADAADSSDAADAADAADANDAGQPDASDGAPGPIIALLAPVFANPDGGTSATITGTNLWTDTTCTVSGNGSVLASCSGTSCTWNVPGNAAYFGGSGGQLSVVCSNPNGTAYANICYLPWGMDTAISSDYGTTFDSGSPSYLLSTTEQVSNYSTSVTLTPQKVSNFGGSGRNGVAFSISPLLQTSFVTVNSLAIPQPFTFLAVASSGTGAGASALYGTHTGNKVATETSASSWFLYAFNSDSNMGALDTTTAIHTYVDEYANDGGAMHMTDRDASWGVTGTTGIDSGMDWGRATSLPAAAWIGNEAVYIRWPRALSVNESQMATNCMVNNDGGTAWGAP